MQDYNTCVAALNRGEACTAEAVGQRNHRECDEVFSRLSLNLSTAINILPRECLSRYRLPFVACVERPNRETTIAMLYVGIEGQG